MSKISRISVKSHCNFLGGNLWNPALHWTNKHSVFVKIEDEEGRIGIGECWCFDSSPDATVAFLRTEVVPHFLSCQLEEAEEISNSLEKFATLSARHGILASALSGIDIAIWDLRAKKNSVPLWSHLNPNGDGSAYLYGSGGLYAEDKTNPKLAEEMLKISTMGFDLLKMKVGDQEINDDLARIKSVLNVLPSSTKLIIDGVYSYSPDNALRLFEELPADRIEAFQSPISASDIQGMVRLSKSGVPVMASEAEYRKELHCQMVEEGAVSFLQVSPIACGGITRLRALGKLARNSNTKLSLEVSSTAIALMTSCHIAAADNTIAHVEYHFLHQAFFEILPLKRSPYKFGIFDLPSNAGLGIPLPDEDVKDEFQLTKKNLDSKQQAFS